MWCEICTHLICHKEKMLPSKGTTTWSRVTEQLRCCKIYDSLVKPVLMSQETAFYTQQCLIALKCFLQHAELVELIQISKQTKLAILKNGIIFPWCLLSLYDGLTFNLCNYHCLLACPQWLCRLSFHRMLCTCVSQEVNFLWATH